ncbi:MAG: SPOR domain-containing protein [Halopseudomonas sp.]
MTRQAKERLVGILLLLAIAAIFLPMVLDGEGVRQGRLQAVIPEPPEVVEIVHYQPKNLPHRDSSELAAPEPTPAVKLKPPPKPLAAAKPASTATTKAPAVAAKTPPKVATKSSMGTDKPVLDKQGVPAAWTLQLASFKERTNAEALQQRLLKRGYKSYIRAKGELSKVFVGPDLQRSVIEGLKVELKRELKLEGLVLRFKP